VEKKIEGDATGRKRNEKEKHRDGKAKGLK